jgi:hypothetical protein
MLLFHFFFGFFMGGRSNIARRFGFAQRPCNITARFVGWITLDFEGRGNHPFRLRLTTSFGFAQRSITLLLDLYLNHFGF